MKRMPNILLNVKDSHAQKTLTAVLAEAGVRVDHVADGSLAEACHGSEEIDVIICDPSGAASAVSDTSVEFNAVNGSYVILVQWEPSGLAVGSHVHEVFNWPVEAGALHTAIARGAHVAALQRREAVLEQETQDAHAQTIDLLVTLMQMYNSGLADHCRRVAELSVEIAQRRGDVPERAFQTLRTAGLLHDIGMTVLPKTILSKRRTERTGDEQKTYLSHPETGEVLLKRVRTLRPVARLVRWHHEQFNGCGFPDALHGAAIPLLARIIAAASSYDNLVHRGRISLDQVPEHLQRFSGYQLEPTLVDLLIEINRSRMHREARRNYRLVYFEDLKVGMRLAQSVQMASGATAVPENTRLTPESIEKLKEFILSDNLSDTFFIYK